MIWFTCKKCGKKHGRADNLSGALVFCDCGQGNPVPWQSSTTAPETPPEPPRRPAPPPPRRSPVDDQWDQRRRPTDDASAGDLHRRRAPFFHRRRPGSCFNHEDVATDKTCADCNEFFCPNCLVDVQGKTLCGPCKNFLVRGLHRPGKVPPLAVVGVIIGMVSSPVTFCMTVFGNGQMGGVGAVVLSLIGLAIPVVGLVVSGMALRQIESRPNLGGRGLAMTGATSSLVGALWCVAVAFLVLLRLTQG